jgi:hypothetical protein
MNEVDGSSGNGAPAPPPAPAESAAAPPTPAPAAVTLDQVKSLMAETLNGFKNAMFADMRKAGALGKDKPAEPPAPAPAPSAAAPASPGLTMDEVKAIVARDRALTLAAAEHKLTPQQVARMTSALDAEKPEDPGTWAKTYLADMGLARTAEQSTPATPVPQPTAVPTSDKGSPAPGGVVNWEREFAENPAGMSQAARALMDAKHGADKARKMRVEAAQSQLARIKVAIR